MRLGKWTLLVAAIVVWAGSGALADDNAATQPDGGNRPIIRQEIRIQGGAQVQAFAGAGGGGGMSRSMSMANQNGAIQFNEQNGDKHLVVKNPEGKALFDGPVNTAEDKKKIPVEAMVIVKAFHGQMGHVRINRQLGGVDPNGGPAVMILADDDPLDDILNVENKTADEFFRQIGEYGVKVSVDREGKRPVVITGKDGKAVFDGPTDTAEQWDKIKDVPADVVAAARKMDRNLESGGKKSAPASRPDGK